MLPTFAFAAIFFHSVAARSHTFQPGKALNLAKAPNQTPAIFTPVGQVEHVHSVVSASFNINTTSMEDECSKSQKDLEHVQDVLHSQKDNAFQQALIYEAPHGSQRHMTEEERYGHNQHVNGHASSQLAGLAAGLQAVCHNPIVAPEAHPTDYILTPEDEERKRRFIKELIEPLLKVSGYTIGSAIAHWKAKDPRIAQNSEKLNRQAGEIAMQHREVQAVIRYLLIETNEEKKRQTIYRLRHYIMIVIFAHHSLREALQMSISGDISTDLVSAQQLEQTFHSAKKANTGKDLKPAIKSAEEIRSLPKRWTNEKHGYTLTIDIPFTTVGTFNLLQYHPFPLKFDNITAIPDVNKKLVAFNSEYQLFAELDWNDLHKCAKAKSKYYCVLQTTSRNPEGSCLSALLASHPEAMAVCPMKRFDKATEMVRLNKQKVMIYTNGTKQFERKCKAESYSSPLFQPKEGIYTTILPQGCSIPTGQQLLLGVDLSHKHLAVIVHPPWKIQDVFSQFKFDKPQLDQLINFTKKHDDKSTLQENAARFVHHLKNQRTHSTFTTWSKLAQLVIPVAILFIMIAVVVTILVLNQKKLLTSPAKQAKFNKDVARVADIAKEIINLDENGELEDRKEEKAIEEVERKSHYCGVKKT